MQRPYRVGSSCEAWCTKCKVEGEHTIIAMVVVRFQETQLGRLMQT